jgi:hypothetical protein
MVNNQAKQKKKEIYTKKTEENKEGKHRIG